MDVLKQKISIEEAKKASFEKMADQISGRLPRLQEDLQAAEDLVRQRKEVLQDSDDSLREAEEELSKLKSDEEFATQCGVGLQKRIDDHEKILRDLAARKLKLERLLERQRRAAALAEELEKLKKLNLPRVADGVRGVLGAQNDMMTLDEP